MVRKGKPASVTTGSKDRTYLCPEIIIVIIIIIITVAPATSQYAVVCQTQQYNMYLGAF